MPKFLLLAVALCAMAATRPAVAKSDPPGPPRAIEVVQAYDQLVVDWPEDPNVGPVFFPNSAPSAVGHNPNMGILGNAVAGTLGAVVAAVQVKNGEERAAKLRTLLEGYDFNARFDRALRTKIAAATLAAPADVVSLRPDGEVLPSVDMSQGPPLFVLPRHRVLLTFEEMSVIAATARAERWVKADGEIRQKLREERIYAWHFPLGKKENSFATADSERWAAFGRDRLVALLDEGIDEVTDMIVHDLTADGAAEAAKKVKLSDRKSILVAGSKRYGRLVEPGPDRVWVRKEGRLEGFHEVDERFPEPAATPR
jgi:hypothetical protein